MSASLKRENMHYYVFVAVLVLSDILNNGNLNLLYFWSIGVMLCHLLNKKYFWRDLFVFCGPVFVIQIVFFLFSGREISMLKVLVYLAKIIINIALFSFFKENAHRLCITKVICYIGLCFCLLLIGAALTVRIPWLWRLNDPFNNYSKTRLQFLYSEPSVLGLLAGYLLVFVSYSILEFGFTKKAVGLFAVFGITLLLTFSLSAMAYTTLAIVFLLLTKLFNRKKRVELRVIIISIVLVLTLLMMLITKNPISNRLIAMFSAADASLFYRWDLSFGSINRVLDTTGGYGLGLGNMNTKQGLQIMKQAGILSIYANSYLYFIAENGYLGVVYIGFLLMTFVASIFKRKFDADDPTSLRLALLLFIFVEQILGGYFTDPLLWCLYGMISACKLDKYCLRIV